MTVKEAAVKWGMREWKVRSYCRKGYLSGAVKAGNRWRIPEGTRVPYISGKRKFTRPFEKSNYVLEAIASGLYLDFRLLALSREEFDSFARKLEDAGRVKRTDTGYEITQAGLDRCEGIHLQKEQRMRENVAMVISVAQTAGAVRQMVGLG